MIDLPSFRLFIEQPLPDWMMNSPEMEVIWRETNLGIIMYVLLLLSTLVERRATKLMIPDPTTCCLLRKRW